MIELVEYDEVLEGIASTDTVEYVKTVGRAQDNAIDSFLLKPNSMVAHTQHYQV